MSELKFLPCMCCGSNRIIHFKTHKNRGYATCIDCGMRTRGCGNYENKDDLKWKERATMLNDTPFLAGRSTGIGGFGSPTKKPCYIHSMDTFSNTKRDVVFAYYDENLNDIESGCSWEELAKTITSMISKGTYKEN